MTYQYNAQVVRWVDGDTVELTVDVGFKLTYTSHFRLLGIDTPERGKPLAAEAKARANALAPAGSQVMIATAKDDKYGRYLAYVSIGGATVNATLISEGLAKPYFGGTKDAS